MADFGQTGGLGDWYGELLNSARQSLVRMPDGSLAPAPQYGGATSLDAIYGGILPSVPSTPLASRSVNTVPIDGNGNPIIPRVGNNIPPVNETLAEQRSGWRPAVTQGVQPALTATMPPGARPANIPAIPAPSMLSATWDPFGTSSLAKDETRLPANDGGEAGFMSAFYPEAQNPAVSAIDQATGVPMPRPRPPTPPGPFRARPLTPYMTSPSYITTPGSPFAFDGPTPTGGNYTVKKGDTVWDLARKNNTTVNAIAMASGLSDPNKIRAGQQLTIPSVPAPRMRPPQMRTSTSGPNVVDEVGALRYHG